MATPILAKIQKLFALSQSKGATEAEATLASEHVQRLLQDNGLTMAQVEAEGGDTSDVGGTREKRTTERRAMYTYQRTLMAALAGNNFCLHMITKVQNAKPLYSGGRGLTSRCHVLVGRLINVQVTEQMYDYLDTTMRRLAGDAGIGYKSNREFGLFLEGATSRVVERLAQRRREAEAEVAPAASNGSGRELVLSDVYGSEADLNNDTLNGFPAGTTATRRRASEIKSAAQQVEHDRLVTEGVDSDVAWYRAYGYSEELAVEAAKSFARSTRRKGGRGRTRNWTRGDEAHYTKINSTAYKAGRVAGEGIGLESQVGQSRRKAITGEM